jgi:hypothetical protein
VAITTTNGKLAIMELEDYWEPGLPMAPGSLDQADKQQLLWGFPEILWTAGSVLAFILDLNTRIFVYLKVTYYPTGNDLSTMINKNLATRTGDMNNRFRALIEDATP